jgi:predicted ATPase
MISKIQALNYRCFQQLDVHWLKYNVLAGPNGSGKSTLLDIPQLFSDILSRNLIGAFLETSPAIGAPRAQSLNELTHHYRGNDFAFVIEAELPENIVAALLDEASPAVKENKKRWLRSIRYEIRLAVFNDIELQVTEEYLWIMPQQTANKAQGIQIGGIRPRNWRRVITRERGGPAHVEFEGKQRQREFLLRLEPDKLALANLPLDSSLLPATVWFIEMLTQSVLTYTPNMQELRRACPPGQPRTIRADAVNLPWMVLSLKQERPRMFYLWVDHVKTALPAIRSIDAVRREDDAYAYLKIEYQGGFTVTSSGLSGGTLAILAYTILPYLGNPPDTIPSFV